MLKREDRLLADFLLERRLVSREVLEQRARQEIDSSTRSLADVLIESGDLERETGEQLAREARELDRSLAPSLPDKRRLGDFELLCEIGRGGMGIVYECRQESLDRTVALKILPAGAALDERLAARFLREARAVARLNHPGIVPVYASGHAEGVLYFAMELIEGVSLARLVADGPLDPRRAASVLIDAARALHHAHQAGLVHRDVKPENIMVDRGGRARVTDFGLVFDATGPGSLSRHVLGTPAYMAPEQALGRPVDARSDVYGLGAVLYHLLCGEPPYSGVIPSVVLGKLLTEPPPPVSRLRTELPEALVSICERAMAREPRARYPTAEALAADLERFLQGDFATARPGERPRGKGWRMAVAALGLASILILALWSVVDGPDRPGGNERELPSAQAYRRIVGGPGRKRSPTLSPHGERIAYSVEQDGTWTIQTRQLGEERAIAVADLAGPQTTPAFSPDGRRLAFLGPGGLYVQHLDGGQPRRVFDSPCRSPSWSPDGTEIAVSVPEAARWRLRAVDVGDGESRLITSRDAMSPSWSPVGNRIAFVSRSGGQLDIFTIPAAGGELVRITENRDAEWSPVWSGDGRFIYYGSDAGGLFGHWRVGIDRDTGRVTDPPRRIGNGVLAGRTRLASSRFGNELAFAYTSSFEASYRASLNRADDNDWPRAVLAGTHLARYPQPSPSGDRILLTESTEQNLFVRDISPQSDMLRAGNSRLPLTRGPAGDLGARWSPDGSWVAFHSNRTGSMELWIVRADGGEPRRLTETPGRDAVHAAWSPQGDALSYSIVGEGGYVVDFSDGAAVSDPRRIPNPPEPDTVFEPWAWSPDGRELAGTARGIVVWRPDNGTYRRLTDFGSRPTWIADTGELVFVDDDRILRLDGRSGEWETVLSASPNRLLPSLGVSADGAYVYYSVAAGGDEIWLLDLPGE